MPLLAELADLAVRTLEICSAALLAYGVYLAVRYTFQEVVMKIGRHRFVNVAGAAPSPFWTRKRVIAAAGAAVALVSLGAVLGATFAPHPNHEQVTQRETPAPAPALETFYVPSQHVNPATLGGPVEEPVQEFY